MTSMFRSGGLGLTVAATAVTSLLLLPAGSESMPVRKASGVGARVTVEDNYFDPRSVTIDAGEAVKWNWKGESRHNVVFTKLPDGAPKKNLRARSDGSASRVLSTPGTYHYECTLYDGMQGSITVNAR